MDGLKLSFMLISWAEEVQIYLQYFYSISALSCLVIRLLLYRVPRIDLLDWGWLVEVSLKLPSLFSNFAPSWAVYISELPSSYLIPWIGFHHVSLQEFEVPEFASRHRVFQPQSHSPSEDSQVEGQDQVGYVAQYLHETQGTSSLPSSQAFQLQELGEGESQSQIESTLSREQAPGAPQ